MQAFVLDHDLAMSPNCWVCVHIYIYVCVFIHTDVTNHKYRFVKDMLETIDQYIGIDDQLLIC